MKFLTKKSFRIGIIVGVILLTIIGYFKPALAIGLLWLCLLSIVTLFILSKIEKKSKIPHLLFLIAIAIHLAAVLFIYWTQFSPFGGGADYTLYHGNGVEIAQRLKEGSFSTEGLHITHYYSILIGLIYFLTLPEMIIPQILTAWLAALSVLLAYFISLEIGGKKRGAFIVGLLVSGYPSYLFFGSVILKDTLVIPLILASLLLALKIIKRFSLKNFLIFYICLGLAIHLRFYIGFAVMFTFIIFWLIFGRVPAKSWLSNWSEIKRKIAYSAIIIPLLGFLPQFSGYGYYGIKPLKYYVSGTTITLYREIFYAPEKPVAVGPSLEKPQIPELKKPAAKPRPSQKVINLAKEIISKIFPKIKERDPEFDSGTGSSIELGTGLEEPKTFIVKSLESFVYVLLGPLPWQIRYYNQLTAFLETFPWYVMLFFIAKGIFQVFKEKKYRSALIVLVFTLVSIGVLSMFINNFGIAARIRIPSYIALLTFIPLVGRRDESEEQKSKE